jgi:hypothetical protein
MVAAAQCSQFSAPQTFVIPNRGPSPVRNLLFVVWFAKRQGCKKLHPQEIDKLMTSQ